VNVTERAQEAYGRSAAPIKSHRAAEFDAFARITRRLRNAAKARKQDYSGFVAALHDNRRLWTTLAVDVAQPENLLPRDLRARIFWLAEFTDAESRRILEGKGDLAALIEINAAVMQGLQGAEPQS